MMDGHVRPIGTKILATVGPASREPPVLGRLMEAGVDAFRLNFSHGTLEEHSRMLRTIRSVAQQVGVTPALVGDLCGPKIRVGEVDERDGGMPLAVGDSLTIQRAELQGRDGRISTNYPRLVDEVQPGERVLMDDGLLRFVVEGKSGDEVVCRCTSGGTLLSRKGMNLPDTRLSISAITEYDRRCIAWAIENKLDYLALSFVQSDAELLELRRLLHEGGTETHVIAKIEKPRAVENIGPIMAACDVVMVARGDLGVEMDVAQVPMIQKEIIRTCRREAKPVIVATQMLQSMMNCAHPTRAEVSDIANAIMDGADAVMLSGETASGQFPVEAVLAMNRVAMETEAYMRRTAAERGRRMPELHVREQDAALARGAWQMADCLPVRCVVVISGGGANARVISKLRLGVPVVAFTPHAHTARRLSLYHGIVAHAMPTAEALDKLLPRVNQALKARQLAQGGDVVLIIGALTRTEPPQSNALMVHHVE